MVRTFGGDKIEFASELELYEGLFEIVSAYRSEIGFVVAVVVGMVL
jgi:hypothetical protein